MLIVHAFAVLHTAFAGSISASVEFPMHSTPDALLALQSVADFNSTAFFPLLKVMLDEFDDLTQCNAEFVFNSAQRLRFVTDSTVGIVKQHFDMGMSIPYFEWMYATVESEVPNFPNCGSVLWLNGVSTCVDYDHDFDLEDAAPEDDQIPRLYVEDKIIGSGGRWVVLSTDFSARMKGLHSQLVERAVSGDITYVLRFKPSEKIHSGRIGGYIATLDPKNTEYLRSGQIDTLSSQEALESSTSLPLGMASLSALSAIKGYKEKFGFLRKLAYNLMDCIPALAKYDAGNLANASNYKLSGINAVVVNGRPVSPTNLFDYMTILKEEAGLLVNLQALLPSVDAGAVLRTAAGYRDDSTVMRYNLESVSGAIAWLNDITLPVKRYEELVEDFSIIHKSNGPFFPLKRNLYTVVVVGSISNEKTLDALKAALQLRVPVQVGFVSTNKIWHKIAQLGLEPRQNFLASLALGYSMETAEQVAHSLSQNIYGGKKVFKPLKNSKKWLRNFDIKEGEDPIIFIDGIPVSYGNWQEQLPLVCARDSQYLKTLDLQSLDSQTHPRSLMFGLGKTHRVDLLDPWQAYPLSGWPLSIIKTTVPNTQAGHHILFESSFSSLESARIIESLVSRGVDRDDIELTIVPLHGIERNLCKKLIAEPTTTFQRLREIFNEEGDVSSDAVYSESSLSEQELAEKPDTLYIDGLKVIVKPGANLNYLNALINRQSHRIQKLQEFVPKLSGLASSHLSAALADRITSNPGFDIWDISLEGHADSLHVDFIINPVSVTGKLLTTFADLALRAGLNVNIVLTASPAHSDVPIKYERSVTASAGSAVFSETDANSSVFTLDLITPPSWFATCAKIDEKLDTDNLQFGSAQQSSEIVYEVRHIVVEGFLEGYTSINLELYAQNGTLVDSTVTINEGYFQLHADKLGNFYLGSDQGLLSFPGIEHPQERIEVSLAGFAQKPLLVNFSPLKSEKASGTGLEMTTREHAEINIFTISSGHLYEHLSSIMMLSVMKNTERSVKFWLIENFISPKFREHIPVLAEAYGFDYEFVRYTWPSWLRPQSNKQRLVWAYKVLFLDVLFPNSLSDIIFIDSDQIVRTDLHDLLEIEMGDAPYALPPMCDDNAELEDYMFWKKGYWANKLGKRGLKYHISALYRVNLAKFRELNAGNIIRSRYQLLANEPDSLANLDQDLLNDLQDQLPIYSLDKDWLWCETWCAPDRMRNARTIDLCNNPLTKESKLDRAQRQMPEWRAYDNEIRGMLADSADDAGKRLSDSVPADVDDTRLDSASTNTSEDSSDEENRTHLRDSAATPETTRFSQTGAQMGDNGTAQYTNASENTIEAVDEEEDLIEPEDLLNNIFGFGNFMEFIEQALVRNDHDEL